MENNIKWGFVEVEGNPQLLKPKKPVMKVPPPPDINLIAEEDIEYKDPWGNLPLSFSSSCIERQKPFKEEELESNLIRIDLDKAASDLAKLQLGIKDDEDTEMYPDYLEVYDKYYDILYKSKA